MVLRDAALGSPGGDGPGMVATSSKSVLEGLKAFKENLAAMQEQVLRSLDAELQRIQQLEAHAAPAAPAPPGVPITTPVDELLEIGPGKESPTPNRRSSNSAWEEDTTAPVVSHQGPGEERAAFASLPTVAEKRRKHMSWIHKNVDQKFPGRESVRGDGKMQPVFSKLHAQYATDTVRMAAIHEFDQVAFDEAERESCWVRFARHPFFERISLAMIYFNAVWLAVDIEFNNSDLVMFSSPIFIVAEVIFSLYFTAEVIIRYMSYVSTMKAFKDLWFIFDFFLVIMMISETWIVPVFVLIMDSNNEGSNLSRTVSVLRVARALRVLRTARIVRVARYMPELMILLKGIMVAARSVFFTLVLLLLITYVFSIALSKMSEGTILEDRLFPSLPSSLLTLIVKCVIPDREIFFREVAQESWLMGALVLFFVLVGSLIVLNMLVGILVEAVQTVATMEHEQIRVDLAKTVLWDLVTKGTKNQREVNQITEEELAELLERPEATSALTQLGVDIFAVKEYSKLLFEDGEPLTFGEFMDAMLTLRGSNSTTVKDIVNLRKFTADEFSQLHTVLLDMIRFLAGQGMSQRLVSDLNDQKKTSAMNRQRSS
mmetsp:Transcript_69840/g.114464  ORF Transcript_69840/g.114464 Transcript_69840/m.114464 type:complete len:601 (+) Transcript_69840:27-1829(+)